ncbi:hypothetical protein EDD86DRAFT_190209 [Gorgonomyces haynaldii]|nr:hypothetical protein EDD86DRAFT_190209 [Gorgonomyces haynaldii]
MANTWNKNPLEHDIDDSIYDIESRSQLNVNPAVLSAYVRSQTPSKIPPYEFKGSEIKSKISSLELEIVMERTLFVTSGKAQGSFQLTIPKDGGCKIGKISVYLIGMEEILAKGKQKEVTRVFLSKKLSLQDTDLAPTDAVHASKPDMHGMMNAKKGVTTLSFSIPFYKQKQEIEDEEHIKTEVVTSGPLPSSYWHKETGGIRYIVCGVVECKTGQQPRVPLAVYREIAVVESVNFSLTKEFESLVPHTSPLVIETSEDVKQGVFGMGKKGNVKLSASVRVPKAEGNENGVWTSGGIGFVGVEIENNSSKPVVSCKVRLNRRINTFALDQQQNGDTEPEIGVDSHLHPVTFNKLIVAEKDYHSKKSSKHAGIAIRDPRHHGVGYAEDDYYMGHFNQNGGKGKEIWDGVPPFSTRSLVLDVSIPAFARSVRYGLLFDVSFMVSVSITLKGGKEIALELPVTILNPLSFLVDVPPARLNVVASSTFNEFVRRSSISTNASALPEQLQKMEVVADSSATLMDELPRT